LKVAKGKRHLKIFIGVHTVRIFEVSIAQSAGFAQHGDYFFIRRYEMHIRY
jgi:hypothetical protein